MRAHNGLCKFIELYAADMLTGRAYWTWRKESSCAVRAELAASCLQI